MTMRCHYDEDNCIDDERTTQWPPLPINQLPSKYSAVDSPSKRTANLGQKKTLNKMEALAIARWFDCTCDPRVLRYFSLSFRISFAFSIFAAAMNSFENLGDLAEVTQSLFVVTTMTLGLVMWHTTLQHKQRISDILDALQAIVDASEFCQWKCCVCEWWWIIVTFRGELSGDELLSEGRKNFV